MRLFAFSWLLLISFTSCKFSSGGGDPLDTIKKIPVRPDQVFDLSGYSGNGDGHPFNLFDENLLVDPLNEKPGDSFFPVTNCQPAIHPAIYFHGIEGNRIVVDLKSVYRVKEIYYFDRSKTNDSCWIYTGSLKKWKSVSSFITGAVTRQGRWNKILLDEETRFVMIRFSSYETAITEMVLYGTAITPLPSSDDFSIHKGFTKTPLNQFLGVNYIMEKDPAYLRPFHYSRLYNFALDYDNDSTTNENSVKFNMLHYGYYDYKKGRYVFDIDTIQRVNSGNIWYSIRGVSKWMSDKGYTDKDRPINHPDMNSEDPASYSRHAEMMWHLSAFFGYSKIDSNLLSLSNRPRYSGRGSMHIFENGNEEDATWVGSKYCSPMEYYAQSTADWDGDEGRLGARRGIHAADSTSRLMMSGLIGLDTNRVKIYRFLCDNLRSDHSFIWKGGIQYHYYASRGGRGISPEEDSMRWKLSRVADFSTRIAPGVQCFLGENGYDKSPSSWQCTPLIPGQTASQSQGIMLLRAINATFFSGFDAYILYWLRDGNPANDPRVYLTSGILMGRPDGTTLVYPGWYYISTLVSRLGKYLPDKIIREDGDVRVYRYRHAEHPDSIGYFIYKPTVNGSRESDFVLETGVAEDNMAEKIIFREPSVSGIEEKIPVSEGKIRFRVGEKPILILYKEPSGSK